MLTNIAQTAQTTSMTLMILAAGIGSRFGGIKQIEPLGAHDELIIDYSIYDAMLAGFDKVVFIIRRDIEKDFCERIFNRIKKHIKAEYVFQELDDLPRGFTIPEGRTKPWGVTQAILAAREVIDGPFCVINADDFYGREAFHKIAEFLKSKANTYGHDTIACASVNFKLINTLSDTGSVSRGVCNIKNGMVTEFNERLCVEKRGDKIVYTENDKSIEINRNSDVAVNFFGFTPDIMPLLKQKFTEFLSKKGNELKAELQVSIALNELLKEKRITMKSFSSKDKWLGFTYPQDKIKVMEEIRNLTKDGTYPSPLWKESKDDIIKISLEKPVFQAYNIV